MSPCKHYFCSFTEFKLVYAESVLSACSYQTISLFLVGGGQGLFHTDMFPHLHHFGRGMHIGSGTSAKAHTYLCPSFSPCQPQSDSGGVVSMGEVVIHHALFLYSLLKQAL